MGTMDALTLGARIREARVRAGYSQGTLGADTGLDRSAIARIEGGTRKVTALELSDIAAALRVRMSSLLSDPPPALVAHRSSQGLDVADSEVDHQLAVLASDVEFVMSLDRSRLELRELDPQPRPTSSSHAETLARHTRVLADLEPSTPVASMVDLAADLGLLMFSMNLGPDTADAGTILLRRGGVSLVNSHNRVGRRRLAAAHELGHYLVADQYTVDWRVGPGSGELESALDRFARALLLPEEGVRNAWASRIRTHELREAAVLVGSEYRVDMSTLARRLHELGILSPDDAGAVRSVTTTRADIVEHGLNVPIELEETSQPALFQKAVLSAYRTEKLSEERALALLHGTFSADDLPELRARREDELWDFVS